MVVKTPPKLPYFLYKSVLQDVSRFLSFSFSFFFLRGKRGKPREKISLSLSLINWSTTIGSIPLREERRSNRTPKLMYNSHLHSDMYVIDNSSSTRRRRSGVLRISSEKVDKKLMYLE